MTLVLPSDDREFLDEKGLKPELVEEPVPGGTIRRGVIFPQFRLPRPLYIPTPNGLVGAEVCKLYVEIPQGYAVTKLDSFYTAPRLKNSSGSDPNCATGEVAMYGETWQFWSRHLENSDWRPGIDGLRTYLAYIVEELRKA